MRTITWISMILALPSYAAAQDLPTTPPSGYFNAVAANPMGTVDNITYGSDNYVARVYTPPNYSESRKYPAMYLMHGAGGSERSWHDNDLYAHIQLDNLLAEGAVDPFIIVFTRNDYEGWSGFGDILINDLIPYVEANYSVCAHPDNRALGGLSMGGMQTINFGFPNADKFHYLMPSSSAPGIQGEAQLFPNDGALARDNLKLIFFSCGSGEVGAYGCNNNNTVRGYSESNGLGDLIEAYIAEGGGHNAATWRPSFWNFAQLAHEAGFTNLAATCDGGGTAGTGGTGAGGANGGSAGAGGGSAGAGGANAQGGTAGMSGSGVTGGAPATGGAMPAAGGTGGATPTPGGQPSTTGGTTGMAGSPPSDDGGCTCALPRSKSRTLPYALFAAAAAVALARARARRNAK